MAIDNFRREQSDFNDSYGYLKRIDGEFWEINISKKNFNLLLYISGVNNLYDELSTFMSEEEALQLKEEIIKLMNQIVSKSNTGLIDSELFWNINKVEVKLRKIYASSGLQHKSKMDIFSGDDW